MNTMNKTIPIKAAEGTYAEAAGKYLVKHG
jgi:hypothetical protein